MDRIGVVRKAGRKDDTRRRMLVIGGNKEKIIKNNSGFIFYTFLGGTDMGWVLKGRQEDKVMQGEKQKEM